MKTRVYAVWRVTRADDSHPDIVDLIAFYRDLDELYDQMYTRFGCTFDMETMISDEMFNIYFFVEKAMTDLRGLT